MTSLFYELTQLELFVELAGGAGNEDSAGDTALAILYAFNDPGGLAALGTVSALGGVHFLLTICCLRNLGRHLLISFKH
jgi:hypothetical protein